MTKYQQLTLIEKQKMIGKLQHAIMKNDQIFHWAQELLEAAEYAGIVKDEVKPEITVNLPIPLITANYYETSSNNYINQ